MGVLAVFLLVGAYAGCGFGFVAGALSEASESDLRPIFRRIGAALIFVTPLLAYYAGRLS
jgi:hypothetical protein